MSQPKRFDFWMYQKPCEHFGIRATMQMEFSENGRCVSWDDYAALAAENERLSASVRHYVEQDALRKAGEAIHQQRIESGSYNREKNETIKRLAAENERLTAEVEWLRKADRLVCWNPTTQQWEVRHEAIK